jgi:hypothetical protein
VNAAKAAAALRKEIGIVNAPDSGPTRLQLSIA